MVRMHTIITSIVLNGYGCRLRTAWNTMGRFLTIFLLIFAAGNAVSEEAPATLAVAIERLRLELVAASNYTSPLESLDPSDSVRRQYQQYSNSLLFAKQLSSDEKSIALLHDLMPRIASLSGRELVEPHISVTNAVVRLHEEISQRQIAGTKDYYIAHTPQILSRGEERTVTVHGNFRTINENYDPHISIAGRDITPIDVTDTDIVFDVPEDLLKNSDELWFSIVAGRSFRPLELVLIRETIRDKRKLYIRSENPLVGGVRWTVPSEDAVQTFSTVIKRTINLTDKKSKHRETLGVAKLLELSDPEAIPSTKFSSIRITGLRWNSKVAHASKGCEKSSTVVKWTPEQIWSYTKLIPKPVVYSSKKKPLVYSREKLAVYSKSPRQKVSPKAICSGEIYVFVAPVFQGLKRGAELDTVESDITFSVPHHESEELIPLNPAFWSGVLALNYDAGPLSFRGQIPIGPQDEHRVIDLPGWRISIRNNSAYIEYRRVE